MLHVLLGLKSTPQEEAHVSIVSKAEVRGMAATFGSLSTTMNKGVSSAYNLMFLLNCQLNHKCRGEIERGSKQSPEGFQRI